MDDIKKELERIESEHGVIVPEAVVAAARDPGSPLHEHFTWDDSKAAESWRIVEARKLIARQDGISQPVEHHGRREPVGNTAARSGEGSGAPGQQIPINGGCHQ